ncbi:uncharacterized protein B0H18DRAFT_1005746 [Fomitopsis serialis]|uniref:uncharacterized protein n=1 Tax=Fomitopsis serialis TaxID=139415 RepID=UPI0020086FDD|nr:uncharacterized protein B0H18DRAFT_1005746 [Neoantrodia serialis]KAH9926372.1 hypothetical protein B0H18DRAFT_1005746 [Neoantrodia serialis]
MPSRVVAEDASDPWFLTIVRTQGLLFVRPEKSWRPVSHEVALGCDGQNPNTKIPLTLHHVNHRSKIDIRVLHKSHKHRKKQHLVASAFVSLGELAGKQGRPGSTIDVRLSCPTPQKKGPTVRGRQQHHANLVVRLHAPTPVAPTFTSQELYPSEPGEDTPSEHSSSRSPSVTAVGGFTPEPSGKPPNGIRRRKRRIRGYSLNTDDEEDAVSGSEASAYPDAPQDEYFPPADDTDKSTYEPAIAMEETPEFVHSAHTPDVLPRYSEQAESPQFSWGERMLDRVAPYSDLYEAERTQNHERFDKVLARLLTEWYVAAASLLALAGIDAAIFGLAPGSIFPIDGLARQVVALGAISAGLGLFLDTLLVFSYSNADAQKFQTIAKDVYGTYFFFCLYCRVPTLCMLVSAMCLMIFLLTVAWAEWPSAVLVVSFLSGVLFTLQYLVFGCHRIFNLVAWCVRRAWTAVVRRSAVPGDVPQDGGEGNTAGGAAHGASRA